MVDMPYNQTKQTFFMLVSLLKVSYIYIYIKPKETYLTALCWFHYIEFHAYICVCVCVIHETLSNESDMDRRGKFLFGFILLY